ncbi:MAG: HEAT repeat domain-containing protein [Spirochaetaceae bacterium]|jgi:hypothetical protein|nr:HEAT repeat domain-containing protein [Spirochaetaceae bacterium]
MKHFSCIAIAVVMGTMLWAQQGRSETTAEQDYLSNAEDNSIEAIIVRELSRGDYIAQDDALTYAEAAIDAGKINNAISRAVQNLATGELFQENRIAGKASYIDIQTRACLLLGKIPTAEVRDTLKKIVFWNNEPSVVTAAIRSLCQIGISDNENDVVETIRWVEKKFSVLNPVSSLVMTILASYEKLGPKVSGEQKTLMIQSISEIAKNTRYVAPVRDRATKLLADLSGLK